MAENSQPLHAFMTPHGLVQPGQSTQRAISSATKFQQMVKTCFAELHDNINAWVDDCIKYIKD